VSDSANTMRPLPTQDWILHSYRGRQPSSPLL